MPEVLTPHNEALMPITMGSPYRVPDYAYNKYGLRGYTNETLASLAYKKEWAAGTPEQLALVLQASNEAGLTNANCLLQQATAKIVAGIIERDYFLKSPVIADIGAGAGASAVAIVEALPDDVRRKTAMILVDPSKESLKTAEQLMEEQGVNHRILIGTDTEVLRELRSQSVDILTGVASIHHHVKIPFKDYARVLKIGGFAVFADWHHDLWEHPARVLGFLEEFDWPQKEEGLINWKEAYPQALNNPDKTLQLTQEELMARKQITRFWLAYKNIADRANLGPNAIWPLEGHRPVSRYIQEMKEAGLHNQTPRINSLLDEMGIPSIPFPLLDNSSLLQVTIAQRFDIF